MGKNNKSKNRVNNKNVGGRSGVNTVTQAPRQAKTDYNIPTLSFKSGLVIMGGAVLGTIILPYFLSLLGMSFSLAVVIGNTLVTSYGLAYSRYFIETDRGYCKGFFRTYGLFALAFCVLGYFWAYLQVYL